MSTETVSLLERILNFSLKQRYLVLLLTAGAAMIGILSLTRLPIDAVPDITNNQIQINTEAVGLSVVEVEKQVTFPVETTLAGIPGLMSTRSLSRNGFSQVTAVFQDSVDIYFARQQVAERLGLAGESLPEGVEPAMGPISTGLGEVVMWTVSYKGVAGNYRTPEGEVLRTDVEKAAYLRTVQDWVIKPQLMGIEGLAGVDSIGGYVKQYHIAPDPSKMLGLGVSFSELQEAVEENNLSLGAGYVERRGESYLVRADGRVGGIKDLGAIVIRSEGGVPVRVRDVADIKIGEELRTGSASEGGKEAVVGTALMLIKGNSRQVAKAVVERLEEIGKLLPPGIAVKVVLNRTELVDATIHTVERNLTEGAALVVVVLLLLLGNLRAAVITSLAIPLAMLLTATGMLKAGISGNLMSLGAVDFGLIVDGAVIIVENCLRQLGHRQAVMGRILSLPERLETVRGAAREMLQPTVYGQAIIITVYMPVMALTGVEGKMFHPMAATVMIALACAFLLSLTVIPALVAVLITGKVQEKENPVIHVLKCFYEPALRGVLRFRVVVIAGAVAVFIWSLQIFAGLGQEFVPTLDEKNLAMHAMRIPSTGITKSTQMQLKVEKVISGFKQVAFVFSKIGTAEMASDPMPPNVADTFIILKPREQWPDPGLTKEGLRKELAQAISELPGNNLEFSQPIQMRFNELISGVRSDVAVKVFGDDFGSLERTAEKAARTLKKIPGAAEVKVEQTKGLPVMSLVLNREAMDRHGISVQEAINTFASAVGGAEAGMVFEGDRRFPIVIRLNDDYRMSRQALLGLRIPIPDGEGASIELGAIADIAEEEGPNQVSRENGKRRVVVQANVRGRDLGSFVEEAREALVKEVRPPPGGWFQWGGQFENLKAARERLSVVVPVCFFLIFFLLFGALGNVKHALLVFSGVPLALPGGILALYLRGMPFSISAAVGFIALSGVAVLNGLVMISCINALRESGEPLQEAVIKGSLQRLRPVVMTALVASLGFVPMALAHGTGAEVQRPLATVVIGGLVSATLLTLVVLPGLYLLFHKSTRLEEKALDLELKEGV